MADGLLSKKTAEDVKKLPQNGDSRHVIYFGSDVLHRLFTTGIIAALGVTGMLMSVYDPVKTLFGVVTATPFAPTTLPPSTLLPGFEGLLHAEAGRLP